MILNKKSTSGMTPTAKPPGVVDTNEIPNAYDIDERCPLCGSTLISNGKDVWCSFVGGNGQKACDFGLNYDIPVDGLLAAIEHESKQKEAAGVTPFGHTQVNEAVKIVSDALPQELRQFAEQLAKTNPDQAEQLCGLLIPLTTEDIIVTMTPERHKRIWRKIQSAMTVADEETELADERIVEQSNQTPLADEEDYYGVRLPASAQ